MVGKLTSDIMASCSRLPGIMNKSKYSTPNDELRKSIEAMQPGYKRDEARVYSAPWWGNQMEEKILEAGCKQIKTNGKWPVLERMMHKTIPLAGSLDGIGTGNGNLVTTNPSKGVFVCNESGSIVLDGPGVLEAKLTNAYPQEKPDLDRGYLQVQGAMLITGYQWAMISTLFGGTILRTFVVPEDKEVQDNIVKAVEEFQSKLDNYSYNGKKINWYDMQSLEDASKSFGEIDPTLPPLQLKPKDVLEVKKYLEAVEEKQKIEKKIKDITKYLMELMGEHQIARSNEYEIEWGMSPARKQFITPAKPAKRRKTLKVKDHGKN